MIISGGKKVSKSFSAVPGRVNVGGGTYTVRATNCDMGYETLATGLPLTLAIRQGKEVIEKNDFYVGVDLLCSGVGQRYYINLDGVYKCG